MSTSSKTFYIETHGCQMNVHDTEKIAGLLTHRGMTPVSTVDSADVYILNTCSVREKAAQKVYSRLGQVKTQKSRNPNFLIGVVGCVAQQESEEMVNKAPFVDMVVGTHLYHSIPDLLDQLENRTRGSQPSSLVTTDFLKAFRPAETNQVRRSNDFRASVTIMEGCNKHCAFCIVPQTRGREYSRPAEAVLDEVERAAEDGYVEIQIGQQVDLIYKHDVSFGEHHRILVWLVVTLRQTQQNYPLMFTEDKLSGADKVADVFNK